MVIVNQFVVVSENVQYNNYVDIFFLRDSKFAKQHNWADRMIRQFNEWQQKRQHLQINEEIEMSKDVTLEIIEPTTVCTVKVNIPMTDLDDNGNPVKLYEQMIKIFKHHNNLERINKGNKIIPIKNIRTITRSKKKKEIIDRVMD